MAWVHPEPSPAGQPLGAEEGPCLAEPVEAPLSVKSDMGAVVRVMQLPDSGLEIRDRMWLKITIANAVIGADVVDWLYAHVEGFKERREARKYAGGMLKRGFLRHTVNKITFSEQCYYVFGDLSSSEWGCGAGVPRGPPAPPHLPVLPPDLAALNLNSGSSGTSDQDTLAPLPHLAAPWTLGQGYSYQYPGPPPCFPPAYQDPSFSYGSGSAGSQQSEGESSQGAPPALALPGFAPRAAPCPVRALLLSAQALGGHLLEGVSC